MNTFIQKLKQVDSFAIAIYWLVLGSAFSCALLGYRFYLADNFFYLFLGWNLFLAWIPLGLAWLISIRRWSPWLWVPVLGIWFLFLPNAPYILTDLYHLRVRHGVPRWFDLTLILTFAWNGLFLGFISFRMVVQWLGKIGIPAWLRMLSPLAWFPVAYGVYLGRYERWNSWDLVTEPMELLSAVSAPLLHPAAHPRAIGFTLAFGAFLWATYHMFVANQRTGQPA